MSREQGRADIIRMLKDLKISPKRSLGQNFLVNDSTIEKILKAVEPLNFNEILEVGPGLGALTEKLKALDVPLTVVEMDRRMAQHWRDQGLKVFEGDALRFQWEDWDLKNCCLVSNLPYQISSSLVIDRSVKSAGVSSMVLMFQKEVAQRILAQPKTKSYGLLSVIAQSFWSIKNVLEASPGDFYPSPNVASRVLKFQSLPNSISEPSQFLTLVKAGFSQRRKLLLGNLSAIYSSTGTNRNQWEIQLTSMGYTASVRAEEVKVTDWKKLFLHFMI